jgi:hypothetical protein
VRRGNNSARINTRRSRFRPTGPSAKRPATGTRDGTPSRRCRPLPARTEQHGMRRARQGLRWRYARAIAFRQNRILHIVRITFYACNTTRTYFKQFSPGGTSVYFAHQRDIQGKSIHVITVVTIMCWLVVRITRHWVAFNYHWRHVLCMLKYAQSTAAAVYQTTMTWPLAAGSAK